MNIHKDIAVLTRARSPELYQTGSHCLYELEYIL